MPEFLRPLLTPWGWGVVAAALAVMEILAPGVFMIWLAGAAAVTALLAALGLGWAWQLFAFAVLSVVAVFTARRLVSRNLTPSEAPNLNRRSEMLVGTTVIVNAPLIAGHGQVRLGDGVWPARGPDLPVGATARVIAVEGTTLLVEPA